jgi:hypothetical protein
MEIRATLDADVSRQLRELCRITGEDPERAANRILREHLARVPAARFRIEARPLGLRPGLDLDHAAELLDRIDGPDHR